MTHPTDSTLKPDAAMIKRYFNVVFGYMEGFMPLRAMSEGGNPSLICARWVEPEPHGIEECIAFAQASAHKKAAFYVVPGTVRHKGQAKAADIYQMQSVMVDLDSGDIDAKVKHLNRYLGTPTLVVESGGITPEGQTKKHIYYQLQEPYEGDDLKRIARLRELIALKAGGDPHFKSLHQPIRVAGSLYHKKGALKLVTIIDDNDYEHDLTELIEKAELMPPIDGLAPTAVKKSSNPLDDNEPTLPLDQLMLTKVREGGVDSTTRFEALSRVIGYWIRRCHEGLCSQSQAWVEIQAFNTARIDPPWELVRLEHETKNLWQKHIKENGPLQTPNSSEKKAEAPYLPHLWKSRCYEDLPPMQRYLVYATFPMRSVSILAAMGDTGKGMLTLDLALKIATAEPYETRGRTPPSYAFGQPIHQAGSVVIFTAEDDKDEVHRRLARLDPQKAYLKYPDRLMVVPLPSAGGPIPLVQQGIHGPVESPQYKVIRKALLEIPDLKLVVFDPLSSFVHADTNADAGAGSFATGLLAQLAHETGATILICHHMRKPSNGKSMTTIEQARDAIRGSSALVDGVRTAYALWPADDDHQALVFKSLNQTPRRNAVFWGAVVKANSLGDRTLRTYLRNDIGLLEDVTDYLKPHGQSETQLKDLLLDAIAKAARKGHPFTHTGGSGIYRQRHRLPACLRELSRRRLESLVQELLNERPVKLTKGMAPGSTEPKWLDIPEGDFAKGVGEFMLGADQGEF